MSMDTNKPSGSATDSELFMARPIWETRGKKKRGLGRSAAPAAASTIPEPVPEPRPAEPRTFARNDAEVLSERQLRDRAAVEAAYPTVSATTVNPVDPLARPMMDQPMVAPPPSRTAASRTVKKGSGPAPALIAGGVIALGALGAAGWYATHPAGGGVPELTPGSSAPATVATAEPEAVAPAEPTRTFRATPPAPQAERAAPTRTASASAPRSRVRPASAAGADSSGVNTAATALPAGPQPYSSVSPSAPASSAAAAPTPAPVPVTPPTNAAPTETTPPQAAEPAPAPVPQETPTPAPETPPQS